MPAPAGRTITRHSATPARIAALVGRISTVNPASNPNAAHHATIARRDAASRSAPEAAASASAAPSVTSIVGTSLSTSIE